MHQYLERITRKWKFGPDIPNTMREEKNAFKIFNNKKLREPQNMVTFSGQGFLQIRKNTVISRR